MSSTGAIPKGARPKSKVNSYQNLVNGRSGNHKQTAVETNNPLEIREITATRNGIRVKKPALHPDWVEKRVYCHFVMAPQPSIDGQFITGEIDAWIERMDFLVNDLKWILSLPHYKFWSQMIYDKALRECLQSYLVGRYRWFQPDLSHSNCHSLLSTVHSLIFLIYLRIATYKESKEDFISPSVFGDLLYNYFLFDACIFLDLSVLYGSSSKPLLQKMFSNIFTQQPKYFNDLDDLVSSLKQVLDSIENKLGLADLSLLLASGLNETLPLEELQDTIEYLTDTFLSLHAFLSSFPKAGLAFRKGAFDIRISSFYEKIIPFLSNKYLECTTVPDSELIIEKLYQQIEVARGSILSLFRMIIQLSCLPNSKKDSSINVEEHIEHFVQVFTTCVEDKLFITDYSSAFDIMEDTKSFLDVDADITTLNFVHEAISTVVLEFRTCVDCKNDDKPRSVIGPPKILKENDDSGMNVYYSGENEEMSDIDEACLITNMKDIFPDYGSAFVKQCLKHFSYSFEETLNALLEDNLPDFLNNLDRSLNITELETDTLDTKEDKMNEQIRSYEDCPLICSRANVYNDDAFDIFSPYIKVNYEKIHKGKQTKDQLEKDPTVIHKVKDILHQYEANAGYSIYDDSEIKYTSHLVNDYDDEYDDTYDDNEAGGIDDFSSDKKVPNIPTMRGRGALNVPGLDFTGEEEEETVEAESNNECKNQFKDSREIKDMNGKFRRENRNPGSSKGKMVFEKSKLKRYQSKQTQNGAVNGECPEDPPKKVNDNHSRMKFEPFCENPVDIRRRQEQKTQSRMEERKRNWQQKGYTRVNESCNNYTEVENQSRNKGGRNNWKNNDGESNPKHYHKGKYKDDSSSKQDNFKHKSENRRPAAHSRYKSNF